MIQDLIFDNTPLSHFARAGRLGTLEKLVAPCRCITTTDVMNEIHRGTSDYPMLGRVVTADWLEVVELQEVAEVIAFARYKSELGGGPDRNNGEAGVLAWAFVNGGTAIIDERAATRIATREGIAVHGTLWLVANAVRSEKLSRPDAERIVDDLADTDMALPVNGSAFFAWAYGEGLLP